MNLCRRSEGRSNRAELDVGVDDGSVGGLGLNIIRLARVSWASTTSNTGRGRILVSGVAGVEPEHVDGMVIPERHDEDVALSERSTHLLEAALVLERRLVLEDGLLLVTPSIGDRVAFSTGMGRLRVCDGLAILDVEALDFLQVGAGADELGDNGELLLCVNGHARAVEVLDTLAVAL